jgi:uncharacterized cofD-like protein
MGNMFQHRFSRGELAGHNLGNLFLAALTELAGSFDEAVALTSHALAIAGEVLTATRAPAVLVAEMEDGRVVAGESAVASDRSGVRRLRLEPSDPDVHPDTLTAIERADLIVLGPGSLYTSVLAALAVPGIRDGVAGSAAQVVYVCNLRPQVPETAGYDADAHVQALRAHGVEPDVVVDDLTLARSDGRAHDPKLLAARLTALLGPRHASE